MFKISNLLNRLKEPVVLAPDGVVFSGNVENNVVKASKNWYEEIADKIKVQRNLLLVLVLILMLLIVVCVIAVTFVVNSKEFDPFVIQINDNTGAATIVNPYF
jgi:type IV secretory pathway component VirB8